MTDRNLESEAALATVQHIEGMIGMWPRAELIDILRGRVRGFAAAYAQFVGPREAFNLFTELADAEIALSILPGGGIAFDIGPKLSDTSEQPFRLPKREEGK